MMNVLLIGSGGRENALAWKIKQSEKCGNLFCLPGNPGTLSIAKNIDANPNNFEEVKKAIKENNINLIVVGPEEPLVNGLRDFCESDKDLCDILFVGPGSDGARLEGSKDFAKKFMRKHGIPTADYGSFSLETIKAGDDFLKSIGAPYVLKADGLAAGKGVLIIDNYDEAVEKFSEMLHGKFGNAGNTVVIEKFLSGIELSVFVLTDGKDYLILPEAKDYKRIGEGDTGLNTGGMGAVSPLPFADKEFMKKVEERIIRPTISGLAADGIDYKGFIFFGLMNCNGEPYVIEYNVRMGDPETEAVMTRIDSDFLSHLISTAKGTLNKEKIIHSSKAAVTVVCVSGGYPESYNKGYEISGITDTSSDVNVFHSGTKLSDDGKILTSGGRVLAITANGDTIQDCRKFVYDKVEKINFIGKYFRHDIGLDVLKYECRKK